MKNKYYFDSVNHIHLLNDVPLHGTSTIASSVGKGSALSWWASARAVESFGWIKPQWNDDKNKILNNEERFSNAEQFREKIKNLSAHEYVSLLDDAYKAHSKHLKKAANKGVDLHSLLEIYVRSKIDGTPFGRSMCAVEQWTQIEPFILWSEKNVKKWLFSEIHVYSEQLWVGGIIDCGFIGTDDCFYVGDFKSGGAWFSAMVQIGGYDIQLNENGGHDAEGNVIYQPPFPVMDKTKHIILSFKDGFKEPLIKVNVEANRQAFRAACSLYKLNKEFDVEFGRDEKPKKVKAVKNKPIKTAETVSNATPLFED